MMVHGRNDDEGEILADDLSNWKHE
jgi:hypothetical protein